jgi:hypothetical protein
MMRKNICLSLVILVILLFSPTLAFAQNYYFNLSNLVVDVFLNQDGTVTIDYQYSFNNDPGAGFIDFVDVAYPSYAQVDENSITADVNGIPLTNISESDYQGDGQGVAIGLGDQSIPPGSSGTLHVHLGSVRNLFFQDSQDQDYASFEFSPAYFVSRIVYGSTAITVNFHLPPGVLPEEPRWHQAPNGWSEPAAYLDEEGRVTYTWTNDQAQADKEYQFGASFPSSYLAAGVVQKPDLAQSLEVDWSSLYSICFWFICPTFIVLIIILSYRNTRRRKLQYLPPKIAIEGHGIKRGLTAVEAAILLEQPLDKVMTMMLFSTVKKGAATVKSRDPLKLQVSDDLPDSLQPYEKEFLQAFQAPEVSRKRELQDMMIVLVKALSNKMKGFSRKETIAYYKSIVATAWQQVEAAGTPEIKSDLFSENLEWTMLDEDYDDRTRRTFGQGPVIIPSWWHRYDPVMGSPSAGRPVATPSVGPAEGRGLSMPTLPGSAFAGSIVSGVQSFSQNVVGNITDFTGSITNKTNPVPVSTSRSSGGGSRGGGGGCACACACAGCACACAGGGR